MFTKLILKELLEALTLLALLSVPLAAQTNVPASHKNTVSKAEPTKTPDALESPYDREYRKVNALAQMFVMNYLREQEPVAKEQWLNGFLPLREKGLELSILRNKWYRKNTPKIKKPQSRISASKSVTQEHLDSKSEASK